MNRLVPHLTTFTAKTRLYSVPRTRYIPGQETDQIQHLPAQCGRIKSSLHIPSTCAVPGENIPRKETKQKPTLKKKNTHTHTFFLFLLPLPRSAANSAELMPGAAGPSSALRLLPCRFFTEKADQRKMPNRHSASVDNGRKK